MTEIGEIRKLVKTFFRLKGKPYPITVGQCRIFRAVTDLHYKWVWVAAPTRYGKSEIVALAILYLAVFLHLKVVIIAGSQEKANKIMEYIVTHLGDNPILYLGLLNVEGIENVERLKVQFSKQALRWANGGWIYITSVDSRRVSAEGEKAIGEGGDVVVLEEAGLIKKKEQFSKIVRMPEGEWGKLVMSGNTIEKSVFEDAYKNSLYYKVRVDLETAFKEGRLNRKKVAQQKTQTTAKDWKRFYLVKFPNPKDYAYFKPQRYELLPEGLRYYGMLDPTLGESAKASLAGIVVLGVDKGGQVYEVESIGELLKPEEQMRAIFNLPYKFVRFGIEKVQFQRYFLKVIEQKSKAERRYIPFMGVDQRRKKEERIESLEPFVNTGQIKFKGDNEMWDELTEYPQAENLDVLDALEGCWRLIGKGKFDFGFF